MHNVASRNVNPQPEEAARITIDEVLRREAAGEQFTYIDVRNPKAYAESDVKVAGALRIALENADKQLADINTGRAVITYCT
jgi:rhodanese-related sulfurtransferase